MSPVRPVTGSFPRPSRASAGGEDDSGVTSISLSIGDLTEINGSALHTITGSGGALEIEWDYNAADVTDLDQSDHAAYGVACSTLFPSWDIGDSIRFQLELLDVTGGSWFRYFWLGIGLVNSGAADLSSITQGAVCALGKRSSSQAWHSIIGRSAASKLNDYDTTAIRGVVSTAKSGSGGRDAVLSHSSVGGDDGTNDDIFNVGADPLFVVCGGVLSGFGSPTSGTRTGSYQLTLNHIAAASDD